MILSAIDWCTWFRKKPQVPLSFKKVSQVKVYSKGKNTG